MANLAQSSANDENGRNHNHGISRGTGLVTGLTGTKDKDGKVTDVRTNGVGWAPSGAHTHGSHNHRVRIPAHTHATDIPAHTHSVQIPSHNHGLTLPAHNHGVSIPNHTHTTAIPSHTHTTTPSPHTHSVSIPSHTHNVSTPNHTHDLKLPDHIHDIQYGIYKGATASRMMVYIDDRMVGDFGSRVSGVNLISYMEKNANGDIMRGEHTIKIVPNALTRVECTIQVRLFTNAHGGAQY
jgi:hypothetical protein